MKREVIYSIFIALIIVIASTLIYSKENSANTSVINNSLSENSCNSDADCIPSSCCHAKSCVSISQKPNCASVRCTMECAPDTLDCQQASCKCINKKCGVIKK